MEQTTHTPTQYTLVAVEEWPFAIKIMRGERLIARVDRVASSTQDKTLDDVRTARSWEPEERDQIRAAIVEQETALEFMVRASNCHQDLVDTLTIPDANAEAERARMEFLRTHPEVAALLAKIQK